MNPSLRDRYTRFENSAHFSLLPLRVRDRVPVELPGFARDFKHRARRELDALVVRNRLTVELHGGVIFE